MPRWRNLCKPGEEETTFYETREFEKRFNIKTAFGPESVKDDNGNMLRKWNRCWSCVPKEWEKGIDWLLGKIREKYRLETLEDDENDPNIQVFVDQIKDKFGSLRFYFNIRGGTFEENEAIYNEISSWVKECEKILAKDDPYYGVPY